MPLLKRKPVIMHPLPSLSTILQPIPAPVGNLATTSTGEIGVSTTIPPIVPTEVLPSDGKDDDEQLEKLLSALRDPAIAAHPTRRQRLSGVHPIGNGTGNGGTLVSNPVPHQPSQTPGYKVKNVDVFYIPETGEMFLDYESFAARRAFYHLPLFQCEVSGKSSLSYFKALQNESREVQQLHSRFPRQLKKAVLSSAQFQVEGKLETLADKIFERFVNRFFDDEKVFVDVQGDKYLARIVRTFCPKNLDLPPGVTAPAYHPYATDLMLSNEEVQEHDDPMKYFYQVRLIEEGGESAATEYASTNGNSHENEEEGRGERWHGSVMEVQADKISRDRINFSRAMLKRFIRDCVHRDAAIFSPWMVKKAVAQRYGLPVEMSDEIRAAIAHNRERLMDKRKREREERLGIVPAPAPVEVDIAVEEIKEPPAKKRKTKAEKEKEKEDKRKELEEEEKKKKKAIKHPAEDLLFEYVPEKDIAAGRIETRPSPCRTLPFGDQFEKFLMSWSFLNVMGKPLGLSPFTLDDFEQSLYHTDERNTHISLLAEIHATLINALIRDLSLGNEAVQPLAHCGKATEDDIDYWEGNKGATTETLRPVASVFAVAWKTKELSWRDGRKGWEAALVGCLWERATLDTLEHYLDNILHLTFEDKPAPTRPTWSTGPSANSGSSGLIAAKPEKRYTSLHFVHKLNIIAFLVELVAQTAMIREFMDESTQALTEVRKEQTETRREWKRTHAERAALEPKNKENEADADGDASMSENKEEPAQSPQPSINGHLNGMGGDIIERDELEESQLDDDADDDVLSVDGSQSSSTASDSGRVYTGAQRRKAMKEKAAEREAEEAMKAAKAAQMREEKRVKNAESKHVSAEKKRLLDEEEALRAKLRQLDLDFRSFLYTLRARPLGQDRFGNKVWWLDGLGSAPLLGDGGKVLWGTGRLYIQGADDLDVEFCRLPAEISVEDVEARRVKEEGEGRLAPGHWGFYDTPEQLEDFLAWLNPKGIRELQLIRQLKQWWPEIKGGFQRRRINAGLEVLPEVDEPARRIRPTRRAAGDEEKEGYLTWKNRRATGRE